MDEIIANILVLLTFGLLIIGVVIIPIQLLCIYIQPDVEVFVDQKLIYKGTSACIDVSSGGYTTTVKTSKFLCFIPDEFYTSKDVVVRTCKE